MSSFESVALADLRRDLCTLSPRNQKRAVAVGCMATLHQISSLHADCDKKKHRRFREMLRVAYLAAEVRFWRGYAADIASFWGSPLQGDLFGGAL